MKKLFSLLAFSLILSISAFASIYESANSENIEEVNKVIHGSTDAELSIDQSNAQSVDNDIIKSNSSTPIWIGGTILFLIVLGWMTNKLFRLKPPYQFEDRPEDFS